MIGALRGTLRRKTLPAVLVDCGGVGYEVRLSLATFEALGGEGQPVDLEIVTLFRNEALELYGFGAAGEKQVFQELLNVSGVGPKIALSLLSALAPVDLVAAIRAEKSAVLEKVPGIGRKTAQRLVLELKDRLLRPEFEALLAPARAVRQVDVHEDAVVALENLGYGRKEAEPAVAAAAAAGDADSLATLLRSALRRLGDRR